MSDYIINRESLKRHCEIMCKKFENSITSNAYSEHRFVLDLLEQTEWIPVSERLPEDCQFVLMTIQRMDESYNHEPFISIGYISWNQSSWWCAHDGDCKLHNVRVNAWMPLPKRYESQEGEKK